jgi:hypothetical protein
MKNLDHENIYLAEPLAEPKAEGQNYQRTKVLSYCRKILNQFHLLNLNDFNLSTLYMKLEILKVESS